MATGPSNKKYKLNTILIPVSIKDKITIKVDNKFPKAPMVPNARKRRASIGISIIQKIYIIFITFRNSIVIIGYSCFLVYTNNNYIARES